MKGKKSSPQLIVALDLGGYQASIDMVSRLDPQLCRLKIGKELFTACGPRIVEEVQRRGFDVFLDLKFHDIPNTTAQAVGVAATLGVWMVNVHASGGRTMLETARARLDEFQSRPLLIAVTVLTSLDDAALKDIGINVSPTEQAALLAKLTRDAGLDGVVCSAREVTGVKNLCGESFLAVTPGIRPQGAKANDQVRTMTPAEAIKSGSDYIVVGRPVTSSADPHQACLNIHEELEAAH